MPDDLGSRLTEFRAFVDEVIHDLDRLSSEQKAILSTILKRVEQQEIDALRASLSSGGASGAGATTPTTH